MRGGGTKSGNDSEKDSGGESKRSVARQYGVSADSVLRHQRGHLTETLRLGQQQQERRRALDHLQE